MYTLNVYINGSCLTLQTLRSTLTIVLVTSREAELRLDCVTRSSSTARAPDDTMVSVHDFDTEVISSVCQCIQRRCIKLCTTLR